MTAFSPSILIVRDLQRLEIDSEIWLFKLDQYNSANPTEAFYFSSHTVSRYDGVVGSGSTVNAIALGKTIRLNSNVNPRITVKLADGSSKTVTITNGAGDHTAAALSSSLTSVPATGTRWTIRCDPMPVSFQGQPYTPLACMIEDIAIASEGEKPRPVLTVADIQQILSGYLYSYGSIDGARLTAQSTLRKYLDGQASPGNHLKYFNVLRIEQCLEEQPGEYLKFEASTAGDFEDVTIGRRLGISCPYAYRQEMCGYNGVQGYDVNSNPTSNPSLDICAHTGKACRARWGALWASKFGGFIGLGAL